MVREELPNGLITEYEYNEFVEKVREKDNTGYQIEYLYDESRTCYRECYYQEDGTTLATEYRYDECARITQIKDANGHITAYEYDTESTQGSYQKASIEVNHELIRRILPKGSSFDELTQEKVNRMMNHINSYKRKKLNNHSPYETFSFYHGETVLGKLDCNKVLPDKIIMKPSLLK